MSKDTLGTWIINKFNTKKGREGALGDTRRVSTIQPLLDLFGRQSFIEQAKQLEREQYLKIQWTGVNTDIKSLLIFMTRLDDLCVREKVDNEGMRFARVRNLIQNYADTYRVDESKKWLVEFYDTTLEQLERATKNLPLNARDEKLFLCLNAISELSDDIWKRAFSYQVLADSKLFETTYQAKCISILCEYSDRVSGEMELEEILAEFKIQSYSQLLECKGSFVYEIYTPGSGNLIDTSYFYYGHVLNAQTLTHARVILAEDIHSVMTIENKANYENMPYDKHCLYIYTHGFFSFKERAFLATLDQVLPRDTTFYHWSDMDYGGMRIFQFMKERVWKHRDVKPYKMGKEDYMQELEKGGGRKIENVTLEKVAKMDVVELVELQACLMEYGVGFEQEGML